MLYTVFDKYGVQRRDWLGAILCHTLAGARKHAQDGDTIQRFGNAGQPNGQWSVFLNRGKLTVAKRGAAARGKRLLQAAR